MPRISPSISRSPKRKPSLLNGNAGVSRKGPAAAAASYYYSLPHMRVAGTITRQGSADRVTGEAWFDHEWSSEYLDAEAVGWDWIGLNLDDGAALMAFRIRGAHGEQRWAGGTLRTGDGKVQIMGPDEIEFRAGRSGYRRGRESPTPCNGMCVRERASSISNPCSTIRRTTPACPPVRFTGRAPCAPIEEHTLVGRGYLELTGYGERLRLR